MREGWVEKKLGNLCVVLDSQRKPVAKINRKKGIFPYYGANGLLDYVDDYIFEGKYVLLGEDGANWDSNASSSYIVDGKIWVNNHAHVIKVNNLLNDEYLVYYLNYKDLNKYISGAIIKKLTQSSLKEINIEYPDLSFQEKIVSELDKISEMISKYDEQLKELDKLSQSIFYEMFGDPVENEKGWEVKTLKNISEKITSGNNAKLATGTYKSEGIPYFRCQNVWKNRIDFKDMVYIDEETNQKLKSSVLKHNDLLITKIGRINTENSSLGRVSIYTGEDFQANLSGNLCFIRLLDTVNPIFVLNIMISNYFRDYIRRTTVGGTDKRALKSPQIGRFPIILPPLPLQQSFARKIEAIEAMKSKVQEAKKEAETLLAARMQYWFE